MAPRRLSLGRVIAGIPSFLICATFFFPIPALRQTMSNQLRLAVAILLFISVSASLSTPLPPNPQKDSPMTQHATGSFEVKIAPLDPAFKTDDNSLGRMSLDKQFHGDLEGTSKGEMLTAGNPAKGAGGYVAMERISGTLGGRAGAFVLQHSGTMSNGSFQLNVSVVPASGTGQLVGLAGTMNIIIEAGKHSYDFTYTLPESH
jgi:hypothetical protein